jgi:tetratricopeptide (TPR) repeat protein
LLSVAALSATALPAIAHAQYDPAKTRPAMQRIYGDLRQLLPIAVDERAFADPANRAKVHDALVALSRDAGALDDHTRGFDPGARYLARSLSRDVRVGLQRFDQGNYEASQYSVLELTSTCMNCHSRLPSPKDSEVSKGFLDDKELAALPILDRAQLQVATRRFDEALKSFETALLEPDLEPIALFRPLLDYLTVCVRVKGDPKRPIPTLQKFAARTDVWTQLRLDVQQWVKDLEKLTPSELDSDEIARAKAMIEHGRAEALHPSDRSGLVEYLAASRILTRVVAVRRDASPDLAEAYYLLGAVEARIGQDFWTSPADFYLEMAVRMAPGTESGRRAYALLEEETLLGFTGSGGEHLPDEERARLNALKALVDGAAAKP